MFVNLFNGYIDYGIGLGLCVLYYWYIFMEKLMCVWFEIILENFMVDGGCLLEVFDFILEQYQVVQYGVLMYFGLVDKLDWVYLQKLKVFVKCMKMFWFFDYLCWGSVDGCYMYDLLLMLYMYEVVKWMVEKIWYVWDFLEVLICVENVSLYMEFYVLEMMEWEFFMEVVELVDCGILFDVNNIYVLLKNYGFNLYDYVNVIFVYCVGQMYVVGYMKFEKYILDMYDYLVFDLVWKFYVYVMKCCGVMVMLLEWDDKILLFDEVYVEVLKVNEFIGDVWKVGVI